MNEEEIMHDKELETKYKELETKYKEMFKEKEQIFPDNWTSFKCIEVQIIALENAMEEGQTIVELDPGNELAIVDNEEFARQNMQKIQEEIMERAKKVYESRK